MAKDGEVLVFVKVKSWNRFGSSDLEYAPDRRKGEHIPGEVRTFLTS